MSELANKAAQEAYVNSLYRMNQEQLIAEVMRVQMAATDLIKQEVQAEREVCASICAEINESYAEGKSGYCGVAHECSTAIMERFEPKQTEQ